MASHLEKGTKPKPPSWGMPALKIRVRPETHAILREIAHARGMTLQTLLLMQIERLIERAGRLR